MSANLKEQVSELLDRYNFLFVKRLVKSVVNTSAQSKQDFIEDIAVKASTSDELRALLADLGRRSAQLGTRQVEVFSLDNQSTKSRLANFFDELELSTSGAMLSFYPFSVSGTENLSLLKRGEIKVMEKGLIALGDVDFHFVVLSTVTEKEVKTSANEYMTDEGLEFLRANGGSAYVYSKKKIQLFHTLYWNVENGQFIISVDRRNLCVSDSQDQLYIVRNFLFKSMVTIGEPMNIFEAINPLYNESDGYIVKLGHVTTQSNPVRLSLKGTENCLKQDLYHNSGESEGYVQAKFAVAKKWYFSDEDENTHCVEIELSGKPAMLDTSQPLTDFSINKCLRIEDFDFAVKNVRPFASIQ